MPRSTQVGITCEACATPFKVKASRAAVARFCSMECRDAGKQVDVACAVCDKRWEVKRSRAEQNATITCSPRCARENMSRIRLATLGTADLRQAICEVCATPFVRKPSQLAKYEDNYCGRACRAVAMLGQPRLDLRTGQVYPCQWCGTEVWRTPATLAENVFCSNKCSARPGEPRGPRPSTQGEKHYRWDGGAHVQPYAPGWTAVLRRSIRERDGNRCRSCGAEPDRPGWLVVHHRDFKKTNHDPGNLITLCPKCHTNVHVGNLVLLRNC